MVLETLSPAERLAFVLHDMFDVPFDEIAPIVGRTPTATRQLASRARRRVQGERGEQREQGEQGESDEGRGAAQGSLGGASRTSSFARRRKVVDAFLSASRGGDFEALLALLDPDVVLRADHAAVAVGATSEVRGARAVAETFSGRARFAQPALVDGAAGAVWAPGGQPRIAFGFTIEQDKIVAIDLLANPERLRGVELVAPAANNPTQ